MRVIHCRKCCNLAVFHRYGMNNRTFRRLPRNHCSPLSFSLSILSSSFLSSSSSLGNTWILGFVAAGLLLEEGIMISSPSSSSLLLSDALPGRFSSNTPKPRFYNAL